MNIYETIPTEAPRAVEACSRGLCAPGDGGVVMVVRVEGCGLVVMDAQGSQGAREHEGLLQLQLSPLDVISGSCTPMLVFTQQGRYCQGGQQSLTACGCTCKVLRPCRLVGELLITGAAKESRLALFKTATCLFQP